MIDPPPLKVVGRIDPPEYCDPVAMLRNIADDIEAGDFGDVSTIAIALSTEDGFETFGGGRDHALAHVGFLFASAAHRLASIPWGGR